MQARERKSTYKEQETQIMISRISTRLLVAALALVAVLAMSAQAQNTYAGGVTGSVTANCVPRSDGPSSLATTTLCTDGTTLTVNTNKVTITEASGNTAIAGTLGVTGNLAVNTNKFNVTASSGNTAVAGTLAATGDFSVGSNTFTVTASSGNTAVSGTLAVTGAQTFTGATALNGGATVATAKTLAVTDADAVTIGGVIAPQFSYLNFTNIAAGNASGDFVFVAPRAIQVTAIKIVQRAQGGSGCVIDVEKLTSTTAPGSGTVLGTGSYNCNSTANNTVTTYTLTGTTGTLQLAAGDRLGVKLGGTLTSLAGATVTITYKAI